MKYLHTMVRVRDLEESLRFYRDALGLEVLSRKDVPAGQFTLVFLAAPGDSTAQVELTHNWDAEDYGGGRNFGHLAYAVDNIYASPVLLADLKSRNYRNLVVVSPDVGGVVRARALAKRLDCELAIIDKRRPKANVSEVMNIIGDVSGRTCVIMDDMVDTANTLVKAATALKAHGAVRVLAYCTHPVLSGGAVDRVAHSDLDELVITDTIPLTKDARDCAKIRQLSCAQLLAETILRINRADSVSSLFID